MNAVHDIGRPSPEADVDDSRSVIAATAGWIEATRERAASVARLAAAEARLAATSFIVIVAVAATAAVLLLSAWGLIAAGIVYALHESGFPLVWILPGLAALHVVAALALATYASRISANLQFSQTRRQFESSGDPEAEC